ncbi:pre-mRNA-splicing factor rbm22 [Anaeramoeba flamelloides]|uniref:Pre-mRNA-splicing factor rbm22 n=1 Tax=Anaeramoeba flamelloides TaxID=1746091 RepID=A0AAV7YZY3_9EUKA|nr:pre-mRNA-splicing factor rbm22 [Anaeramoeba flamelloides]
MLTETEEKFDPKGFTDSEFPCVCVQCLGPSKYIKMLKRSFQEECPICYRPQSVFSWTRNTRKGGLKKTKICYTCSKIRNCCACCLHDLKFGLPLKVRDYLLGETANQFESKVNKEVSVQLQAGEIDDKQKHYESVEVDEFVLKLLKRFRQIVDHRASVCSFWIKGKCNRGASCPFRHEMPKDHEITTGNPQQTLRNRYYGSEDKKADEMIEQLIKIKSLKPPTDLTITTLKLSGMPNQIANQEVQEKFAQYGEIEYVLVLSAKQMAYVKFKERKDAQIACEKLFHKLNFQGMPTTITWDVETNGDKLISQRKKRLEKKRSIQIEIVPQSTDLKKKKINTSIFPKPVQEIPNFLLPIKIVIQNFEPNENYVPKFSTKAKKIL